MRRLSLRGRLALLIAVAVAVAVAACATVSWFLVRKQLYDELDRRLTAISSPPPDVGDGSRPGPPPRGDKRYQELIRNLTAALEDCTATGTGSGFPRWQRPFEIMQAVNAAGRPCTIPDSGSLTITGEDVQVAKGERDWAIHDGTGVTADGTKVDVRVRTRQFTANDGTRGAVSYAIPLDEVQGPLDSLALLLLAVSALGVLASALTGLMIARASLRPVHELTGIVEHIARTEDLDAQIPADGADEIARLSRSFNTMTTALAASRDRQQQLIADAGHELRTPLTSLRTNIDLLLRAEASERELPADTRHNLLTSVKAQMLELSSLVGDLLELARPEQAEPVRQTVALHDVVERAVERARLRGIGLRVEAKTEPWYVLGDAGSLERAVVNLLDNAVKFSPASGVVEVRLHAGELTVRDQGPGIPAEELPHVFERFWRSPSARSLPGSGLGLSIVARVVQESGGQVALEAAPGGGTLARIRLPGAPAPGDLPGSGTESRNPVSPALTGESEGSPPQGVLTGFRRFLIWR